MPVVPIRPYHLKSDAFKKVADEPGVVLERLQEYKPDMFDSSLLPSDFALPEPKPSQMMELYSSRAFKNFTPVFKDKKFHVDMGGKENVLKEISQAAVSDANVNLILSTHLGENAKPMTVEESKMCNSPFTCAPCIIGPNNFIHKDIRVNIMGATPATFMSWVALTGMDLHSSARNKASHSSGGHACLRTFVNLLQGGSLNTTIKQLYKMGKIHRPRKRVQLVCVGDKYAKTTNILNACLRWSEEVWYPIRETDSANHTAA